MSSIRAEGLPETQCLDESSGYEDDLAPPAEAVASQMVGALPRSAAHLPSRRKWTIE